MKKILITGASSGIGQATAMQLVRAGNRVLMAARRVDKMKALAAETPTIAGEFLVASLDVTDTQSIDNFVRENEEWLKDIDVLVNNAGLALGRDPFASSNMEDIEKMVDTNVTGMLRITRKILPYMVKRKSGHIVNLGSVAGRTAYNGGTVYCATKAAVHMATDALRYDLGGTGIRVSTIAPGRVAETEFSEVRYKGDKQAAAKVYEGYRVMKASDVAEAISWVISMPEHVNVQELVILPTDQPSATALAPLKI